MTREVTLFRKDPQSIEPVGFDWTDWLGEFATPELVVNSDWVVSGPDALLVIDSDSVVSGNLKTQAIFSGGTLGASYIVTNRVTTTSGYTEDASFPVFIENQ